MKQLFTLFSFLLFLSLAGYSQLSYNVNINSGMSNIIKYSYMGAEANPIAGYVKYKYEIDKSFILGGDINYRLSEKRFAFGSGIGVGYSSAYTLETWDNNKFPNHRISVNIPLRIYHIYEEWLWIYAGVTNQFDINSDIYSSDFEIIEKEYFNIGFNAGLDFIIKNKYTLGVNYNRDINTHFTISENEEMPYRDKKYQKWHQAYLKLGYIIK